MKKKSTILLVDDEPDVLVYLTVLLEDHGYDILTASDGQEALDIVMQVKPDLISLDLSMPHHTGLTTYAALRENEKTRNIPVIILTGVGTDFRKMLESQPDLAAPDGFFEKPIDREQYITAIEKLVGSASAS